ncbi:GNAT family N-acetyltransferase [Lentzea tibetensis]|uniref:GNAT family N-acetyltransferase n=1 Tax=Lentzea tibetensis TaxID=2591470 RepID=A0A563EJ63_9PSEU|nr:GNAT family N-acetyltransferase [Lentzea tibetensis]TWP46887.1 GNAT family N-acetyltransferase [Lentzea tibetensis]
MIERLRPDHGPALLAFEQENRAYFAAWVPDRGDAYFTDFDARHRSLLAEQATGLCHFHLVLDADGSVLGRVNLVDVAGGTAELGFRIALKAAGKGLATASVRAVCDLARTEYGLTSLRASAAVVNTASRTVLSRAGFVPTGSAVLSGEPAISYVLRLTSADTQSSASQAE